MPSYLKYAILFVSVLALTGCTAQTSVQVGSDTKGEIKLDYKYLGDSKWEYTLTADLPTPCHEIKHEVVVLESYPEQVKVNAEIVNPDNTLTCIQVIQEDAQVTGTFSASEQAKVSLN